MAAVRRDTCDAPGKVLDLMNLRPPTDATQSRPYLANEDSTWCCPYLGIITQQKAPAGAGALVGKQRSP